ncbi:neugrin isoform X1 [Linepithema humile]|uniref:neugrin isoform X1 n=2 Tax=Linepithema humile TaxID=83485 RepID=UPI00351F1249
MMKEIKILTFCRMFSRRSYNPLAGIRHKVEVMKEDGSVDLESFDIEDTSEYESDFMKLDMSHKMHEREMQRQKEKLKQQITAQKYFTENEPRFITFAERELIHKLHRSNPEEWTVNKLSESFPALPGTIQKILNAKWLPKSVERVIEYDKVVVENWKKFRAGKLPVSPLFNEHLMKFKNRKIILTDRESLAKQFVLPEPEFKKPKSQLFSNIVQTCLNEKQNDEKLLSQKEYSNKVIGTTDHLKQNQNLIANSTIDDDHVAVKNSEKLTLTKEQCQTLTLNEELKKRDTMSFNKEKNNKLLTFDEFIKAKLEDIRKESPEEGIVLLDTYRKQVEANQELKTTTVATVSDDAEISVEKSAVSQNIQKSNKSISVAPKNEKFLNIVTADDNLLDTSIKIWNKKIDTECNYAKPIKIAKHLHKPGMMYRINDCYYDDDGEFLYRIPGVRS